MTYRLNEGTNMTMQTQQVCGHNQRVDADCDYNVTIHLGVTASSPAEAAKYALNDLRDTTLGPWSFAVSGPRGEKIVVIGRAPDANLDGRFSATNLS
jgi:hypothetical protein